MADQEKFKLLRKILGAIGLSPDAVDDLVDRVVDLLSEKPSRQPKFPYHLRDDFLSPAEHNFYLVLKDAVQDQAVVCPKVSLSDLFYAKSSDYGEYLTYTGSPFWITGITFLIVPSPTSGGSSLDLPRCGGRQIQICTCSSSERTS